MNVDNVFAPIEIAVSGLRAQSRQMEIVSSNIANAQTVDDGSGRPYRRLEAVLKAQSEGIAGVDIDGIVPDMSEFQMLLNPGHPRADGQGYVAMPNVSLPVEIMNMTMASRAYQANAAVLKRCQWMVESTLRLLG